EVVGRRWDVPLGYDPDSKRFLVLGGRTTWADYKQPRSHDVLALDESEGAGRTSFPPARTGDHGSPGLLIRAEKRCQLRVSDAIGNFGLHVFQFGLRGLCLGLDGRLPGGALFGLLAGLHHLAGQPVRLAGLLEADVGLAGFQPHLVASDLKILQGQGDLSLALALDVSPLAPVPDGVTAHDADVAEVVLNVVGEALVGVAANDVDVREVVHPGNLEARLGLGNRLL